jgi:uncharacterized RDD family membrane protein YckC
MLITCPCCGFSKEISDDRVPGHNTRVTCPKCKHCFPLHPVDSAEVDSESTEKNDVLPAPAAGITNDLENIPKAGFWIRVVAALVDSLVVTVLQFILVFLLLAVLGLADQATNGDTKEVVAILAGAFSTLIGVIYYVFFTGYCGQTPGKMALRIKVMRTNGKDIGFKRALLREVVGKFISTIVLCIGYIWVAIDPQKQGWHDKIAGTYVIKLL